MTVLTRRFLLIGAAFVLSVLVPGGCRRSPAADSAGDSSAATSTEVIRWVRQNAVPITTVRAENGFGDMEPLKAIVSDARIVAMGEATRGTKEFFQFKHRMFETSAARELPPPGSLTR